MDDDSIRAADLHFRVGRKDEANAMVIAHHYSGRLPSNVQVVCSLHLDGGLFGRDGPMVAAAYFSIPGTRWSEETIELSRLVRATMRVPLSRLISLSLKWLRTNGHHLVVSFADKTQGHEGYVYRASNFRYSGLRGERQDGLVIDGTFIPGRSCNSKYGTRSKEILQAMYPSKNIAPHYDKGKHLYWMALTKEGKRRAERIGLKHHQWEK